MSTQQQNNVPVKGQIIINPQTSRPVKVGGRTWLKLVKDGLVEGTYSDPNEICDIVEETLEEKIEEINRDLPTNQQAVRGRGKYAGKIVKRSKSVKARTAKPAKPAKPVNNSEELYFETQLENMIMAEMKKSMPKTSIPRGRTTSNEEQYYEQPAQEYDDDEQDENDGYYGHAEPENYYE